MALPIAVFIPRPQATPGFSTLHKNNGSVLGEKAKLKMPEQALVEIPMGLGICVEDY